MDFGTGVVEAGGSGGDWFSANPATEFLRDTVVRAASENQSTSAVRISQCLLDDTL